MYLITAAFLVASGERAVAQNFPPRIRYSGHEYTLPVPIGSGTEAPTNFQEWMVDVKTPGDFFIYAAGSITINTTSPAPTQFSGANAFPSFGLSPFTAPPGAGVLGQRQVGILQIVGVDQVIQQQRYFHGTTQTGTPPLDDFTRATNVRGVSVWPTGVAGTTRVAICGETYDQTLPECDSATGWAGSSPTNSGGFIAVYNGAGLLLWTWHFFGGNAGSSAVTDLSIRVDATGTEVVTYCGISSHGNPVPNGTLGSMRAFLPPAPGQAGGDTDNGAGQWDGFVGRLERPAVSTATQRFHSVVGGVNQDGLFGLAELDEYRFAVVGSTGTSTAPAIGTANFPLAVIAAVANPGNYALGVLMVFDSVQAYLPTNPRLVLESATNIGLPVNDSFTVARDIVVQPFYSPPGILGGTPPTKPTPIAVVVGSTIDGTLPTASITPPSMPTFFALPGLLSTGPQATLSGGVDGFILTAALPIPSVAGAAPVLLPNFSYRGGEGTDVLTGVSAWNEFTDHFVVTGYVNDAGGQDIEAASYVIDTTFGYYGVPLVALTAARMGGTGIDRPTAVGAVNATATGAFATFGLGDPAGGGVGVDSAARVNVVGTTASANYPVSAVGPNNYAFAAGRNKTDIAPGTSNDGTRTVLDLLPANTIANPAVPVLGAVGRTDSSGQLPTGVNGTFPTYPLAGFFGGTTPECSLTPFGFQIGVATPALANRRMLIDYEGALPVPSGTMSLIVSRMPTGIGGVSVWQIGLPGVVAAPIYPLFEPSILLWIDPATAVLIGHPQSDSTVRFPLTLPPVAGIFSAQLIALPAAPVGGIVGGGPAPCTTTSAYVASPAMWIRF